MTMEKSVRECFRKRSRILLLFLAVFIFGWLASTCYCYGTYRIQDYTVSSGIYVWDSEKEESTIYVYYPYRNKTAISVDPHTFWIVWLKQGETYAKNIAYKPEVQKTEGFVTRKDLLTRFSDPEIVDTFMKHDYLTELSMTLDPFEFCVYGDTTHIVNGTDFDLVPIKGKENLSYAYCKVGGQISGLRPDISLDNYFPY